jgi:hypothetical protein
MNILLANGADVNQADVRHTSAHTFTSIVVLSEPHLPFSSRTGCRPHIAPPSFVFPLPQCLGKKPVDVAADQHIKDILCDADAATDCETYAEPDRARVDDNHILASFKEAIHPELL